MDYRYSYIGAMGSGVRRSFLPPHEMPLSVIKSAGGAIFYSCVAFPLAYDPVDQSFIHGNKQRALFRSPRYFDRSCAQALLKGI